MADDFRYDVFLSHSSKDKAVVRPLAERLRADGLRVWYDEWELKPGDNILSKIEEGLEYSRVLVLCMSAHAFGSDWAQLESGTFRFRDPLNKERRFIPLRLDEAPLKGSLAQFLYINWLPDDRGKAYAKLLEACRPPAKPKAMQKNAARKKQGAEKVIQLDYKDAIIQAYVFSPDGEHALSVSADKTMRLWDVKTGRCLRVFEGHTHSVDCVAWSADQCRALSGGGDRIVRLWDVETGQCLRVLEGHMGNVDWVALSANNRYALSGARDETVRLWDVETGQCLRVLEGHTGAAWCVAWSADGRRALSSGSTSDITVRLWDVETGQCLRVLEGHASGVLTVVWSEDQRRAVSGSFDNTVRLWDVETGQCLRVLEGHTSGVWSVALSANGQYVLSGGLESDNTVPARA
jgi:WD40 repeat protein